jgi:hypothetical protein
MKVPQGACRRIGLFVFLCAFAGVLLQVTAERLCGAIGVCLPANSFLAMALIAVIALTFFGFLAYGTDPEDMRTAIAVTLITVYLVLVSDVAFYGTIKGSEALNPLTQTMITSFTAIVGIVIPSYFGASAYAQAREPRAHQHEAERERDELRRELESLRADQRQGGQK